MTRAAEILTRGTVLVTGGQGFLGRHVVSRLRARGLDVLVLDRIGGPLEPGVRLELGDVSDAALVGSLARQCSGIINLAGVLGTSETVRHPHGTVQTNLLGALNVYDAARAHGCRVAQITVGNHFMDNPYAITKSAAERFAFHANARHGTRIAVVRGLNAYGEGQKEAPVRKIIPNFVLPALRGDDLIVYGDGQQRMDMIYVGDVAEILVRALTVDHGVYDRALEAGTGIAPTVDTIAERVLAAVPSSRSRVVHVPMRAGEPERSVVVGDPKTLAPLGLGVDDLRTLDDGLARTVAYYRSVVSAQS